MYYQYHLFITRKRVLKYYDIHQYINAHVQTRFHATFLCPTLR